MFKDSLTESSRRRTRRSPYVVILSLVVHAALLGVAILVPLVYTDALPSHGLRHIRTIPPTPPVTPGTPPVELVEPTPAPVIVIEIDPNAMITPTDIPEEVATIVDDAPRSEIRGVRGVLPVEGIGDIVGGLERGGSVATPLPLPLPLPPPPFEPAPVEILRVNQGVMSGNLIERVQPEYPALARSTGIEGLVLLEGMIATDGTIRNLRVITGHPLLTAAAVRAIEQWVYEPYRLNGEPIEVLTTFTLTFRMN
jgi:protein TonB